MRNMDLELEGGDNTDFSPDLEKSYPTVTVSRSSSPVLKKKFKNYLARMMNRGTKEQPKSPKSSITKTKRFVDRYHINQSIEEDNEFFNPYATEHESLSKS